MSGVPPSRLQLRTKQDQMLIHSGADFLASSLWHSRWTLFPDSIWTQDKRRSPIGSLQIAQIRAEAIGMESPSWYSFFEVRFCGFQREIFQPRWNKSFGTKLRTGSRGMFLKLS